MPFFCALVWRNQPWHSVEDIGYIAQGPRSCPILAREWFDLLPMTRASVSKYEGLTRIAPPEALETVTCGFYLAKVFSYIPNPKLPPRRIEAIFRKEHLHDSELLEAFAAHLPGFVNLIVPETSTSLLEPRGQGLSDGQGCGDES